MKLLDMSSNKISRIIALAVALCAFSAFALERAGSNSIESISASSASGKLVIKVALTSPPQGQPAAFTINTPPRIAFDFPNTTNGLGTSMQTFGEGDLRSANIVQAGTRTRLVINLAQMVGYDTRIEGNDVLITLQPRGVGGTAESIAATHFADASSSAQLHSLRDIDFRRGKNGEGRIQIDLSDANIGIDIKQQGRALIVDFQRAMLPRNLQRKLDVADFATPVQMIDAFVQGDNARLSIEPKGIWEYSAYQTDNKFIIEVKAVVDDPNRLVKGNVPGYSGEKLTLNFQNISTREALSVIADFTGLNMVISDTVSGNLTLRLKDVPWDQAFEIILQSRDLDRRKNGNVIHVAPREEIAAKEKSEFSARQEISELEPLRTENFELAYAKAADIVKLISDSKQTLLSKRGSASFDLRTNMLFVKDTPSSLEEVRKLIKQIDVPVRQVMIEARFVEANDKFGRDLGVRLGYNTTDTFKVGGVRGNIGANSVSVPAGTVNPINGVIGGTFTANANTPNVNLPVTNPAGTFSMLLFNSSLSKLLSLELTALETDSKGKVISSPRVVTADNVKAIIKQGVEIPYQEASSSGATATSFKDATLSLEVTPQITPDDNVMMKVLATKNSESGRSANGVPIIATNEVDTQVLVENGGTVVIGGVFAQTGTTTVNKVPLLGDVPLLGALFRNTNRVEDKSELLIFITPKIMKGAMNLH